MGMWVVYPEAMGWNVGAVYSEINLGECIWRSDPQRANLKVQFEICSLGATSADKLTQMDFWVHSANIPGHCLWIDSVDSLDRHPACLCLGNVKFSLFTGWAPFWGKFPTIKNSLNYTTLLYFRTVYTTLMYSVHCIAVLIYSVHCTALLYSVHCTAVRLFSVYCTVVLLYSVHYTDLQCTLHWCTVYTVLLYCQLSGWYGDGWVAGESGGIVHSNFALYNVCKT